MSNENVGTGGGPGGHLLRCSGDASLESVLVDAKELESYSSEICTTAVCGNSSVSMREVSFHQSLDLLIAN